MPVSSVDALLFFLDALFRLISDGAFVLEDKSNKLEIKRMILVDPAGGGLIVYSSSTIDDKLWEYQNQNVFSFSISYCLYHKQVKNIET